jgi:hypothetical protein
MEHGATGRGPGTGERSWRRWLPPLLCVAATVAVYEPVLRVSFIGEDYQIALKGAKVIAAPAELFQPFQRVWRPAAFGSFAVLGAIFGDRPAAFRAVCLALTAVLALLGYLLLRRLGGCSRAGAAALCVLWQVSPLYSELICGEALFLGHQLFVAAVLAVVLLRGGRDTPVRRVALLAAAAVAAAASEQWVMLPAVLAAQDLLVLGRTWRRAARTLAVWAAAAAAYLAAYGLVTRFGYRSFYTLGPALLAAKSLVITATFFHVIQPVPLGFVDFVRDHPWVVAAAPLLLAAMITFLVRARHRKGLFLLVAAALLLLPTLPNGGFTGRWAALPWLLFLAAAAYPLAAMWELRQARTAARVALVLAGGIVLANGLITVRGDIADWSRVDMLTRRLDAELAPLLDDGRAGRSLVVFRYDDSRPWLELLAQQRGQPKIFMPRPDDPYGVVSLSALLTWRTYRQGLAWERLARLPAGGQVAVFAHGIGGFRRLPALPAEVAEALAPGGRRTAAGFVGAVVLRPTAWAGFTAREFP